MSKQVTFLMCSPRGENSASHSLGSYMVSLLEAKEISSAYFRIYKTLNYEEKIAEMITAIDQSDIIIISSPLYIDSAPSKTIELMSCINEASKLGKFSQKKRLLFAISCGGFPEYYHNNIALRIYQQFALESEFEWAGGLPIGGAMTYAQHPMSTMIQHVRSLPENDPRQYSYGKATMLLNSVMTASVDYLSKSEVVPPLELQKLEKVMVPLQAFIQGGNGYWHELASKNGVLDKIRDKPYEPKS